jgi:DNA repair exonuclease SbcCD ATPase subunit
MQKHQEFLLKLLMDKSSFIRKKIMDQNLFFVNQQMAHYLEKLCLPHDVVFQSDLSVEITLLGRDFDFEQLSRGEMNRVIMATSWAFRDVWESVNQSCNLLFVDEMIDSGMDTQGVEAAISILKDMTRTSSKNVFLISHKDELQSRIDKTLVVRKENGFTSFDTAEL